jgi:RND family efflux transporter MFP subunit
MRIWKQTVLSLAVLGAAAALWVRYFPDAAALLDRAGIATASVSTEVAERSPAGAGRGGDAPIVLGAPAGEATINDSVSAIGDGRAARSVSITPYVAGRVVAVEVSSGDFVREGVPLVRLDSGAEAIALDRARLTLEDARDKLGRDQALFARQTVNELTVRTSELAAQQAELAVRDAELAHEHRVIRAPFDGWVGIIAVDIGDQVSTATEVATLDDRSTILVDFRVPERFIGQIRVGAPISARPLALPGLPLEGEVQALDSRVSPDTRTLLVRGSLDNADDLLRAGMAFAITMRFPGESYIAVDPLAIQWSADGAYVWIGPDGRAEQVPVRIVQRNNDAVLVDADLAPGTRVVTQGVQLLRDGAPFRFEGDPLPEPVAAPAAAQGGAGPRPKI